MSTKPSASVDSASCRTAIDTTNEPGTATHEVTNQPTVVLTQEKNQ